MSEPERTRPNDESSILDVVFERRDRPRSRVLVGLVAAVVALAMHAAFVVVASRKGPSLETWAARVAVLVHADLASRAPVAIESSEPPPPPPEPPRVAAPRPAPAAEAPASEAAQSSPAAVASVVSAPPDAPVDLTGDAIVTGTASAYAGGVTSTTGTSESPVRVATPTSATPAPPPESIPDASRPVRLDAVEWSCRWPAEAEAAQIYEQFVVLRVVVRDDGSVERATVSNDPGSGFGDAAIACAMRTRFTPAEDASGRPVRALSPPIRVRFRR